MNNTQQAYEYYIRERTLAGSNKAASYIRALELLNNILDKPSSIYPHSVNFWAIDSIEEIRQLYQHALKWQKIEGSEYRQFEDAQSYGKNGYYSAALRSYGEFLTHQKYEEALWKILDESDDGEKAAGRMNLVDFEREDFFLDELEKVNNRSGKEILREVKTRANQHFFRKMILRNYRGICAISELNISEVLRASHIVPWSEDVENRLNPCNGLCLSATYDAAFDRHLISFDEDYRLIFSPSLREYCTNKAFKDQFIKFEGQAIKPPKRFKPDQKFLEIHRQELVS